MRRPAAAIARFESHAGDVELLRAASRSGTGQREAEHLVGDSVLAEMLSLIEGVARAGHVLRELGNAVFGVLQRCEQVACAGLSDFGRFEAVEL